MTIFSQKTKFIKTILLLSSLIILVILADFLHGKAVENSPTSINSTKDTISKDAINYFRERAMGDFNGDGEWEVILAFSKDPFLGKNLSTSGFMAAYDEQGNEIARTAKSFAPEWSTLPGHMETYQLDKNSKKVYLRLRRVAGTHQFDDLFMSVEGNNIIPVCKSELSTKLSECIFYNSSYDQEVIRDLDKDGFMEVTEIIDEYPSGGGRGRPVVSEIYKFNGKYFESQKGVSYNRLFSLLAKELSPLPLMKSSNWSEEGKYNFEEIKSLWEHR